MNLAARLSETRRQDALDAIAETAVDLFARDGYEATSVDVIARAAGCSPRTFYRYFKTKEDVMFYDLPEAFEGLDAMIVALSGRIHLDEAADTTPEIVLTQIWEDHFILEPAVAAPG